MPEIHLEPASDSGNANESPDCDYVVAGNAISAEKQDIQFGRNDAKSAVRNGGITKWPTLDLPFGTELSLAKLTMRAAVTDSGSWTCDFAVIDYAEKKIHHEPISFHNAKWTYFPVKVIFPPETIYTGYSWVGEEDDFVRKTLSLKHGLQSIEQVWTANETTTLKVHYFLVEAGGSMTGVTTWCEVWSVKGSNGAYEVDALLNTSLVVDGSDLPTGSPQPRSWVLSPEFPATSGTKYMTRLVIDGGSGGSNFVDIYIDFAGNGVNNANCVARSDRLLSGFGGMTQFIQGQQITDLATEGSIDAVTMPNFSSGALYTFGHADYDSPTKTLGNLTGNLQQVLDDRDPDRPLDEQNWAVRFDDPDGATDDRERKANAYAKSTVTIDGKTGVILSLVYTFPQPVEVESFAGTVVASTLLTQAAIAQSEVESFAGTVVASLRRFADIHPTILGSGVSQVALLGSAAHDTLLGSGESVDDAILGDGDAEQPLTGSAAHDTLKGGDE